VSNKSVGQSNSPTSRFINHTLMQFYLFIVSLILIFNEDTRFIQPVSDIQYCSIAPQMP